MVYNSLLPGGCNVLPSIRRKMGKDKRVLYIGNLRRDIPLRELKNNLLDLFCNYLYVELMWDDIEIRKGKRAWFAFIDTHGVREASETLEDLATWENRRNLGYNFTNVAPPYESITVDYKKVKKVKKVKKDTDRDTTPSSSDGSVSGSSPNNNTNASGKGGNSNKSQTEVKSSTVDNGKKSSGTTVTKQTESQSHESDNENKVENTSVNSLSETVKEVSLTENGKTNGNISTGQQKTEDDKSQTELQGKPLTKSIATSVTGLPVVKSGITTSTTGLPVISENSSEKCYSEGQFIGNETRNREFKLGSGQYKRNMLKEHTCKYVCSFLNSGEEGTLLVGVKDTGYVVGFPCSQTQEDDCRLTIDAAIKTIQPAVFPNMYNVQFVPVASKEPGKANLKVIEISVKASGEIDQLYATNDDVYIRRDGSVQGPLKGAQIQEWTKKRNMKEIQRLTEHVRRQEELLMRHEEAKVKHTAKSQVCSLL